MTTSDTPQSRCARCGAGDVPLPDGPEGMRVCGPCSVAVDAEVAAERGPSDTPQSTAGERHDVRLEPNGSRTWYRWTCSCGRRSGRFGFPGQAEAAGRAHAAAKGGRLAYEVAS